MVDKQRLVFFGSLLDSTIQNFAKKVALERLHNVNIGQGVSAWNTIVIPLHHIYQVGHTLGLLEDIDQEMVDAGFERLVWRQRSGLCFWIKSFYC